MNVEQQTREYCPVAGEEVTLTRLFSVEGGGSCQMDIGIAHVSCERSPHCPGVRMNQDCLLNQ